MALYAFDGTWNDEKDTGVYGENTNVVEFAQAYNGPRQVVQKGATEESATVQDDFFAAGVGTRHGFLGKVVGGAFGVGGRTRVREAKQSVAQNFAAGDEVIDIVGFSRGAALALQFANVLGEALREPERPEGEATGPVPRALGRRRGVRHPHRSGPDPLPAHQSRLQAEARRAREVLLPCRGNRRDSATPFA